MEACDFYATLFNQMGKSAFVALPIVKIMSYLWFKSQTLIYMYNYSFLFTSSYKLITHFTLSFIQVSLKSCFVAAEGSFSAPQWKSLNKTPVNVSILEPFRAFVFYKTHLMTHPRHLFISASY